MNAHVQIPLLADVKKEVAARYGVLKRDVGIALRGLYRELDGGCLWWWGVHAFGGGDARRAACKPAPTCSPCAPMRTPPSLDSDQP